MPDVVRTIVVAGVVFLFCGLVLPAPQNDMELKLHHPSAALVTGDDSTAISTSQKTSLASRLETTPPRIETDPSGGMARQ